MEEKKKISKVGNLAHKKSVKKNDKKKTVKKESFLDHFSWKMLHEEIESYGYKYSFKNFVLQTLLYFGIVAAISIFSKLELVYILILLLIIILAMPFLVRSQFRQMYNVQRYEMVTSYLDNVLPVFKNRPNIPYAWSQVEDLTDGEMSKCIHEAYEYVMNNTSDNKPYETAFEIIESHFPNSRIHAVHKMMLTVVMQNSKNYQNTVDNLFMDTTAWISRTARFQEDLRARRNKLVLLCLITMCANMLFIFVYGTNEVFAPFTDQFAYQLSTTIFLALVLMLMCAFYTKLSGEWLIDDRDIALEKKYEKSFNVLQSNPTKKASTPQIILSVVLIVVGVVTWMLNYPVLIMFGLIGVAIMFLTNNRRYYNLHKKRIRKALEMEFPVWLRDVALNLQNLTVLNAIENSLNICTPILKYYVQEFLEEASKNPTDIRPYNNFLSDFNLPDIRSSMKVLYTMQSLSDDQLGEQVGSLIERNQELLAHSEQLRNEDSVSGLVKYGFAPVVLFMLQMIVSMILMFSFMMTIMNDALSGISLF